MNKIRVVIVDDQTLMRDGLKTIIDLEEDMEVIGTAPDGKEGYKLICEIKPEVVLLDIRMPKLNGVEAARLIKNKFPNMVVIMLTTFDDEEYIIEALCNGADGYLLKDMHGDKLLQSIRDAYNGNMLMPANIAAKIASRLAKMTSQHELKDHINIKNFDLTEREKEIGVLVARGYTNKEISEKLFISIGTVKNYITNIYSKIGVNNRTAAVLYLKKMKF